MPDDVVDALLANTKGKFELHITDVRTYLGCRRRWDWSSNIRQFLEPNVTPVFFAVGRAVHQGLADFYESGELPEDVFVRELDKERASFEKDAGTLWPEEIEKYDSARIMGEGILHNYRKLVIEEGLDDDWEPVATEMSFKVPIMAPNGRPSSRIYLAGRFDGIFRKKSTGELWLREYKTSAREPDVRWLEMDIQAAIYCWAAQQIIGEPIAGVLYRFLMKRVPSKPERLKGNRGFSRAINSKLHTTYVIYHETLMEEAARLTDEKFKVVRDEAGNLVSMNDLPEKYALYKFKMEGILTDEYSEVLEELSRRDQSEFMKEIPVHKTQAEINTAAYNLWVVGLEMVRPNTVIYPSPDWLKCTFCPFRAPCKVKNAGGDYESILRAEYRNRKVETGDPLSPIDAANKVEW